MRSRRAFVLDGLAMAGALALAACGRQAGGAGGADAEGDDASASPERRQQVGLDAAWEPLVEGSSQLTDDEADAFARATESLLGFEYEPVAVLATQVVAGTNYAFLCKGQPVVAEPEAGWYVVAVYEDLSGEASIFSADALDARAVRTRGDEHEEGMVGAWAARELAGVALEPSEAEAARAYAAPELRGIATLGTLVVEGDATYWLVLCEGGAAGEAELDAVVLRAPEGDAATVMVSEPLYLESYIHMSS